MAKQEFICSDNIAYLKTLPDNSLDSIVTDAPYGLGKEPDVNKMLQAWITTGYLEVKGSGFMGKKWDSFVPQPLFWKEVLRVLKPGGHVICFFGTRTYDWGVIAMRIAGFEIRDQIQWLYGSGFPKSMNISKALDKRAGVERSIICESSITGKRNKSSIDDEAGTEKITFSNKESVINYKTAPATDEAKTWDGYGTALKPANEPIVLARKPIEKGLTISENILKWGTGGLNIDAGRIPFSSESDKDSATFGRGTNIIGGNYVGATHGDGRTNILADNKGRFPANIILDPEAAAFLDEQTGILKSGAMKKSYKYTNTGHSIGKATGKTSAIHGSNSGGASRFFYVAKSSRSERNKGCENLYWERIGQSYRLVQKDIWESLLEKDRAQGNFHPTVKPVSLMSYLVRMVTPIGGKCADLFSGSGSTGPACKIENIEFVGVDVTPEYIIISNHRLDAW